MIIYQTKSLIIQSLKEENKDCFIELMTNPLIIDPGSHQETDSKKILETFSHNIKLTGLPSKDQDNIWGVYEKSSQEMIGIVALLVNEKGDWEMGYRFVVNAWAKGYGTQVARGMVDFFFDSLNYDRLTADVDIKNKASVKILEKIMVLESEFYNEVDRCVDRRYEVTRAHWMKKNFEGINSKP